MCDDIFCIMCQSNDVYIDKRNDDRQSNSYSFRFYRNYFRFESNLRRIFGYIYSDASEWRNTIVSMEGDWHQCGNEQFHIHNIGFN